MIRRETMGDGVGSAVADLIHGGCVLREQLDTPRQLGPEERLMLAVLEDACIAAMRNRLDSPNHKERRVAREAWVYIDACDQAWPFSFESVCRQISIDPGYLRRGLEPYRSAYMPRYTGPRRSIRVMPGPGRGRVVSRAQSQDLGQ